MLHLVGFLLTLNEDARNHELKIVDKSLVNEIFTCPMKNLNVFFSFLKPVGKNGH